MHPHLVDFKILDRNGRPPFAYEQGPKDVVYVGENETVRVIMRFAPNRGRYMMHCHNTVHEDHDMMVQFEVGTGGDDPITGDPPRDLPAPALQLPANQSGSPTNGPAPDAGAPARQPPSPPNLVGTKVGNKAKAKPKRKLKTKRKLKATRHKAARKPPHTRGRRRNPPKR